MHTRNRRARTEPSFRHDTGEELAAVLSNIWVSPQRPGPVVLPCRPRLPPGGGALLLRVPPVNLLPI